MFRVSSGKAGAAAILCAAVVCGLLLSQAQARGFGHFKNRVFGAHVPVRYCGAEIARQHIEETEVEVVLSGGVYKTSSDYNCQQYTDSFNNLQSNEAVEVVQEWLDERPARKRRTLVVVVGDHDTGGFGVNGPYGSLSEQGDLVEDGWTSGGHTAVDTVIWSQGPGSRLLGRPVDNTDLFGVMKKVMGERRTPSHRFKRGAEGAE